MHDRRQGSHLGPLLRPGPFAAYWWVTVPLGVAIVARSLGSVQLTELFQVDVAYWLLVGFVVLGEVRPVVGSSRNDPDGVNLGTAFLFAILLRWGLDLAVLAMAAAAVIGELARRKRFYAATFNVAQYALAYTAAWAVLRLTGWTASASEVGQLQPHDLGIVALAAAAYHLVNLGVVGIGIGLAERRPLWGSLTDGFRWYTVTTGSVLAIAPLVVVVIETHWGFLPLLLLPLFLLWTTARMSLERERRGMVDELTGLANRAQLADEVDELGATLDAPIGSAALCLIDLDRFKEVNDTFGHTVGDRLLQTVAARLRNTCRDRDVVARLGGDEFVLLLRVTDADEAEHVADRVTRTLLDPYDVAGARLELEVSAGLAMWPDDGVDLETLLRRADTAMYSAKESGETTNRFDPSLEGRTPSRLRMLSDLRRALEEEELELHYQPQVSLVEDELVGVEALVRWRHPTDGLLLPETFLPLAERTSLMRQLTCTVLNLALDQLTRWRREGLTVPLAINVSPHDLADVDFASRVADGLHRRGLLPSCLRLEVTEEALVGDPSRVLLTLSKLHDLGIALSLDDFGTGHASLTRLKQLPVEEVKIDRSFVVDLGDGGAGADDAAIVRSIVELGSTLGLRTLAEGVERDEQWRALEAMGCDAVQGWLVAPAMPEAEATGWLRERIARSTASVGR